MIVTQVLILSGSIRGMPTLLWRMPSSLWRLHYRLWQIWMARISPIRTWFCLPFILPWLCLSGFDMPVFRLPRFRYSRFLLLSGPEFRWWRPWQRERIYRRPKWWLLQSKALPKVMALSIAGSKLLEYAFTRNRVIWSFRASTPLELRLLVYTRRWLSILC